MMWKQQKLGFFFLTLQFSNCKTQLCCQLARVHPQDPHTTPCPSPSRQRPGVGPVRRLEVQPGEQCLSGRVRMTRLVCSVSLFQVAVGGSFPLKAEVLCSLYSCPLEHVSGSP